MKACSFFGRENCNELNEITQLSFLMAVLAATIGTRYIQFLRTDDPYLP